VARFVVCRSARPPEPGLHRCSSHHAGFRDRWQHRYIHHGGCGGAAQPALPRRWPIDGHRDAQCAATRIGAMDLVLGSARYARAQGCLLRHGRDQPGVEGGPDGSRGIRAYRRFASRLANYRAGYPPLPQLHNPNVPEFERNEPQSVVNSAWSDGVDGASRNSVSVIV
jgi:hypothetical protein